MTYTVPEEYEGLPLRTYLLRELRLSHRLLTRLKAVPDGILLDGRRVMVRAILHAGETLSLAIEDDGDDGRIVPSGVMPHVLYEDGDLIVCDKAGDMPTHPSHGHFDDTLANALATYDQSRYGRTLPFRPVNRLDRETSGVVLIARNALAAARLAEQMQGQRIRKVYLALLDGSIPESGTVSAPIRRAQPSIILREVCAPDAEGAQAAITHYRTVASWQTADGQPRTLVLAFPETGRTHQLRLHFAHLGAPILGDGLYGREDTADRPSRQLLHALSLTFWHPTEDRPIHVVAPIPDEMWQRIPTEHQASVKQIENQPSVEFCS